LPLGCVGLASQSGSMMASMLSHAADVGAGFSACSHRRQPGRSRALRFPRVLHRG
jgi:hypothetical protein